MEDGGPEAPAKSARQVGRPKALRWTISAVALAAVGGAAFVFIVHPYLQLRQAKHDVDVLALSLEGYATEHDGAYPQGKPAEIARLLLGQSVGDQNPQKLDYIETEAHEINAAGELIDPWGTPYRILFTPSARVYSCGPNRVDEQGNGDDITSWK